MKEFDIEQALIKAVPKDAMIDANFTNKVMGNLRAKPHNVLQKSTKRSFTAWLIHLPKFALVILALATLFTISGAAYAIVETIKIQKSVEIQSHGKDERGREQLTVGFNNCEAQKKVGTTYEVKKDSGLTSDEAAKTLEARCEIDAITNWLKKDAATKAFTENDPFLTSMHTQIIGTISTITPNELTLDLEKRQDSFVLPESTRVVENGQAKERGSLQLGESVLLFSPYYHTIHRQGLDPTANVILFKLGLPPKYYGLEMQWYVGARGACSNNPERSCLLHNNINTVFLRAAHGGANHDPNDASITSKSVQGRITEYTNSYIKVDVGGDVIYTIQTPYNVIGEYNRTTVYSLASYDLIYANTDPEDLKIAIGDSLDINYIEPTGQASQTLAWQNVYGIDLMVERMAKDISILSKY